MKVGIMTIILEKNGEKIEKTINTQFYFIIHMFVGVGIIIVSLLGREKGHTKRYLYTNLPFIAMVIIGMSILNVVAISLVSIFFFVSIFINAMMLMYFIFYIDYWDVNELMDDRWKITNQNKQVIQAIQSKKQPKWVIGK